MMFKLLPINWTAISVIVSLIFAIYSIIQINRKRWLKIKGTTWLVPNEVVKITPKDAFPVPSEWISFIDRNKKESVIKKSFRLLRHEWITNKKTFLWIRLQNFSNNPVTIVRVSLRWGVFGLNHCIIPFTTEPIEVPKRGVGEVFIPISLNNDLCADVMPYMISKVQVIDSLQHKHKTDIEHIRKQSKLYYRWKKNRKSINDEAYFTILRK
ncbi:MAG: hypothetical protein U5P10_17975 [Spirochaetia bacterium]|nr:hypothetical protein [Spirochaetia bacterium]